MTNNLSDSPKGSKWPEGWWREKKAKSEWYFYEDFRAFLWVIWDHLNLPAPTPIQKDIAIYLQAGPRRRMIMAFRGVGKSWVTSAYALWLLYRDPDHKILVVSASKERATAFSTFTMRLIAEVPMLQHLQPGKDQRSSVVAFDVGPAKADHAPSVKSVGINGQIAGSRADTIVPDDIEVPANSQTQTMRDALAEAIKEFDAVLKPGGQVVYLGTPQSEMSVYNVLPERGYHVRIWPARAPTPDQMVNYGDKIAPYISRKIESGELEVGDPTDPDRFDNKDLQEREMSYGRSGFNLQFQLDTTLSDAERYPLKLKDLIVYPCQGDKGPVDITYGADPRTRQSSLPMVGMNGDHLYAPIWTSVSEPAGYMAWDQTIMWIDPSGRGKDETSVIVLRHLKGRLFLLKSVGFLGDGYDREKVLTPIRKLAVQHDVTYIGVESNFGDGMFEQILQSAMRDYVEGVAAWKGEIEGHRVTGQKEVRIVDTLEPVMNQHRLVVDPSVIEDDYSIHPDRPHEERYRYMLFHQMTRLTKDRGALAHDDRIDCLAQAVGWFVESMARDLSRTLERAQEDILYREAIEGIIHRKSPHYMTQLTLTDPKAREKARKLGLGDKASRFKKAAGGLYSGGIKLR